MDDCPDSRNIASFRLPFSRGWGVKPPLSSGDEDLRVARGLSVLVVDMLPGSLQKVEEILRDVSVIFMGNHFFQDNDGGSLSPKKDY